MAALEGVNFVRIFFYLNSNISPEVKASLVALAYATARDKFLAPKAILIRSGLHNTTTRMGKHVIDPQGWHGTFAFKTEGQLEREYHVASHGYTNGKQEYTLTKATHTPEKADGIKRGGPKSRKVVWPDEESLEEYTDSPIGYSHIAGQR